MIDVRKLSTPQWNRLVSKSGLKQEDWGEGWLALVNLECPTESDILNVLQGIAATKAASVQLRQRLLEGT